MAVQRPSWDKSKSYEVGQIVSYNGYDYVYINSHKDSTKGEPPDTAMFTVPKYGEKIRSWTIWFSTWDENYTYMYNDGAIVSRGLPDSALSGNVVKFETASSIAPKPIKATEFQDQIYYPNPPQSIIHEIFDRDAVLPGKAGGVVGYSVEFRPNIKKPDYWYSPTSAISEFYFIGPGNVFKFTQATTNTLDKVILNVEAIVSYAYTYIHSGGTDNSLFLEMFNMFGRNFRFKFAVKHINIKTGKITYTEPEYGNVSTGEFRDNFLVFPSSATIERMKPGPFDEYPESYFIFKGPPENPWEGEFKMTTLD